jgi:hypothetical protein
MTVQIDATPGERPSTAVAEDSSALTVGPLVTRKELYGRLRLHAIST